MRTTWLALVSLSAACRPEFSVQSGPKVPPAEPPGDEADDLGDVPDDWRSCPGGWRGIYSNLTVDDPFVAPRPNEPEAPTDPTQLDWWDRTVFEKFDPSLDFGQNWWPVDEGLEEDPKYFAVYWHAWLRAWSNTSVDIALGSADDAWVYLGDDPIIEAPGIHPLERQSYGLSLDAGVYPIRVWFAHRGSESAGFSFRVLSGDVSICYPDFVDEEQADTP